MVEKSRLRKQSIYTHFPEDRNCDVCFEDQNYEVSMQKTPTGIYSASRNIRDLITADHKVLNEECESRKTITDTLSWFKILPLRGYNLNRVKLKLCGKRNRACESSSSHQESQRSFTLTILWNWEIPVKIYHGIIGRQHLIDLRRTALLSELYVE